MAETQQRLQHADLSEGKKDFLIPSCCLRRSWRCPDLRISKLGVGLFQLFFQDEGYHGEYCEKWTVEH